MAEDLDTMGVDSLIPGARRAQPAVTITKMARIKPFTERRVAALILHLLKTGDILPASGKCEVIWSAGNPLVAMNGPSVAENRLPLYPQQRTFSWPSLTSACDPKATFQDDNDRLIWFYIVMQELRSVTSDLVANSPEFLCSFNLEIPVLQTCTAPLRADFRLGSSIDLQGSLPERQAE